MGDAFPVCNGSRRVLRKRQRISATVPPYTVCCTLPASSWARTALPTSTVAAAASLPVGPTITCSRNGTCRRGGGGLDSVWRHKAQFARLVRTVQPANHRHLSAPWTSPPAASFPGPKNTAA